MIRESQRRIYTKDGDWDQDGNKTRSMHSCGNTEIHDKACSLKKQLRKPSFPSLRWIIHTVNQFKWEVIEKLLNRLLFTAVAIHFTVGITTVIFKQKYEFCFQYKHLLINDSPHPLHLRSSATSLLFFVILTQLTLRIFTFNMIKCIQNNLLFLCFWVLAQLSSLQNQHQLFCSNTDFIPQ